MKNCKYPNCKWQPVRNEKLCKHHLFQRNERREYTAQMNRCKCGNISRSGSDKCGKCIEVEESKIYFETLFGE